MGGSRRRRERKMENIVCRSNFDSTESTAMVNGQAPPPGPVIRTAVFSADYILQGGETRNGCFKAEASPFLGASHAGSKQ